jgi:hypothetical protein
LTDIESLGMKDFWYLSSRVSDLVTSSRGKIDFSLPINAVVDVLPARAGTF